MIINNNLNAMNAHRNMSFNTAQTGKAMEKLSSGLRINRAGDDAAGLAISEKMRGQIRGLEQATRNSQDGISMIQTAEGALNESHDILQRMRELSVQSGNDTNTNVDRKNIQDEMTQLTKEIDRISTTTQFNSKNLLDGSMSKATTAQANTTSNDQLRVTNASTNVAAGTALTALLDKDGNSLGIEMGDTITVSYVKDGTTVTNTFNVSDGGETPASRTLAALGTTDGTTNDTNTATVAVASGSLNISASGTGSTGAINGFTVTVKDANNNIRQAATNALSAFSETVQARETRSNGSATLQIGANTDQSLVLDINSMSASALGVKDLKVETQSQANVAIKVIDNAIQKVTSERSKLGATQNRLEHTINNLNVGAENLQAAESRIRDVDMAKEMMNFTKNNILNQAAQAMLAQSKSQPEAVLQLLR
ncbi:flagellin [Exiguobacterium alkaliphilum]|uniref:flagellin N-terminal helical domain-containing protein n=1 Tax=Exiguobacterium alkaliphilum TaxID=1428684 RepID=UPI001BA92840|nr:flagellin [Exiguobacterium alkaliphilum]QUE87424.1 flagellin [Exiguobacterium alkaliphilum]